MNLIRVPIERGSQIAALCGLLGLSTLLCIAQGTRPEIWFAAGEPELLDANPSNIPLLTEEAYRNLQERMKDNPVFVGIREKPSGLTGGARFGFNLTFAGKNRSFALDGNDRQGYLLYADLNGNGSLADDQPRRLLRDDQSFSVLVETALSEEWEEKRQQYALRMKLVLGEAVPPGGQAPIPVIKRFDTSVRRGTIWIEGKAIRFALLGRRGTYNEEGDEVILDLNQDGLDLVDWKSRERFQVSGGQLNIDGVAFRYRVDRYGRGIGLTPLLEAALPDRPSLQVGSRLPDISMTDAEGQAHRLSHYRGRVLLLDFWAVWCAPCRADAPRLVKTYERFRDRGLVIISINAGDSAAEIKNFIGEFGIAWPQVRDAIDGPVHQLLRVRRWPTYYLVGRDGRILADHIDWSNLDVILGLPRMSEFATAGPTAIVLTGKNACHQAGGQLDRIERPA